MMSLKIIRRNFLIHALMIFLILNLSSCSQTNKKINLRELTKVKNEQVRSIRITNMGDGSKILLSNREDIELVMNYLDKLQIANSIEDKMTLTGYSVRFITDDAKYDKAIHMHLDGSYAYYEGVLYSILNNNENDSLNVFFEEQFEKKWGIADSGNETPLEKLMGIDFGQVKKIMIMEPYKGIHVEIKSSEDITKIADFMNSVHIKRAEKIEVKFDEKGIEINTEPRFNFSFFLNETDTETVYNVTFTERQLFLGSKYWYDIVNDMYNVKFFKNFSRYF